MNLELTDANSARSLTFRRFSEDLKLLSKCSDKGTAAIIVDSGLTQVFSIGINGGPQGGYNCMCKLPGKYTCIHAEANALIKCESNKSFKVMYCTYSPCVTCAAMIVNSGFRAVLCGQMFHDDTGLKILYDAGIQVFCWNIHRYQKWSPSNA